MYAVSAGSFSYPEPPVLLIRWGLGLGKGDHFFSFQGLGGYKRLAALKTRMVSVILI